MGREAYNKILISALLLLSVSSSICCSYANNVSISDVMLYGRDDTNKIIYIQFTVEWENSFRGLSPTTYSSDLRYDALWAFVKFRKAGDGNWYHAILSTSGSEAEDPFITVESPVNADSKCYGALIYRTYPGSGTTGSDITLSWNWGPTGNNLNLDTTDSISEIRVFAIEMVYVAHPENFYLGDGTNRTGQTNSHFWAANDTTDARAYVTIDETTNSTMYVSNKDDGTGASSLDITWVDESGTAGTIASPRMAIPTYCKMANWYDFYAMKYEITQGQYRDFLNTLTQAQQNNRVEADISDEDDEYTYVMAGSGVTSIQNRQTIKAGADPGDGQPYTFGCDLDNDNVMNEDNDGEDIAMNFMNWMDLCAYADWAGLRPLTEIEFEKLCRGCIYTPVQQEYAWATTEVSDSLTTGQSLLNAGESSEVSPNRGNGLSNYGGTWLNGPMRVGFAATDITNRQSAGAGDYGCMNLCGNVWEMCVSLGNTAFFSYQGTSGDGTLYNTAPNQGDATNTDWPGYSGGDSCVSGAAGSGLRGGSWENTAGYLRASDRYYAGMPITTRHSSYGGRLVRDE